jgi:hypothetical protein
LIVFDSHRRKNDRRKSTEASWTRTKDAAIAEIEVGVEVEGGNVDEVVDVVEDLPSEDKRGEEGEVRGAETVDMEAEQESKRGTTRKRCRTTMMIPRRSLVKTDRLTPTRMRRIKRLYRKATLSIPGTTTRTKRTMMTTPRRTHTTSEPEWRLSILPRLRYKRMKPTRAWPPQADGLFAGLLLGRGGASLGTSVGMNIR